MLQSQFNYLVFYYCIIGCAMLFRAFLGRRLTKKSEIVLALLLSFVIAIIVGGRPLNVGTDTPVYYGSFYDVNYNAPPITEIFGFGDDPILTIIFKIMGVFFSAKTTFIAISFAFTFLCYAFSRQFCKLSRHGDGFTLFTFILLSHTAFNFEINIIRVGIGTTLWLLFTISLYRRNKYRSMFLGFLAIFTHFSTAVFIVFSLMAYLLSIDLKKYVLAYFISIAMAVMGVSVLSVFNVIELDMFNLSRTAHYISDIDLSDYKTGFRLDFTIFNTLFLILSLYLNRSILKRNDNIENHELTVTDYYLKIYILSSVLFFLWFAIPYSDRIGAFSWILIPTITYIPLTRKFRKCQSVVYLFIICYGAIGFMLC